MTRSVAADTEHRFIDTGDVSLHVTMAGPGDGEPVVLLHGFPEFWYGWRYQIPVLADAGYRVIAPDQRGYNKSDKPNGIEAYTVDKLAADVSGLLDGLGYDSASFVGHDWGAGVLWQTMLRYPDRVDQGVIINVPHPEVFEELLTSEPRQLLKSYYMFFYQLPRVPEFVLSADGWRGLRWFIDTSNREDVFTDTEIERYREAWERPGAITAMLNWYRALFRGDASEPPTTDVTVPTTVVWGTQDPYLVPEMAEASVDYCQQGRLELFEDATHWVQHERSEALNELLIEWLASGTQEGPRTA